MTGLDGTGNRSARLVVAAGIMTTNHGEVSYTDIGDRSWEPLFYFHGTPSCSLEALFWEDHARRYRVRLIAIDRPGIGRTTYTPDFQLLDWPKIVSEVALKLGIQKFGVVGYSGGGPYAIACAVKIPEKLNFVGLYCPFGPTFEMEKAKGLSKLDYLFSVVARNSFFLTKLAFVPLQLLAKRAPSLFYWFLFRSVGEADQFTLASNGRYVQLLDSIKNAFKHGVNGPARDAFLLYLDWGFKIRDVRCHIDLWFGEEDELVPMDFIDFYARELKYRKVYMMKAKGHFNVDGGGIVLERFKEASSLKVASLAEK